MGLVILFLGAGKRLSLLERFLAAGQSEEIDLRLVSIEDSELVPIAQIAKVVLGPSFGDRRFTDFLVETVERTRVDLVVPNMDAATVALASAAPAVAVVGARAVVSDLALCSTMEDKASADAWFRANGYRVPGRNGFPQIVKRRRGFGSRDQAVVHDEPALASFLADRDPRSYFIQDVVHGQEYTVDAYVARDGRILGALSRKRLKVSDGEVDVSETHRHFAIIGAARAVLATEGWEGPITLQYIGGSGEPTLIEVNPRFGGGVTHSIECGLDMPRWIIREALGRPVEPYDGWKDGSVMTRCRRDVFL